jgi:hypothetical protein
MAGHWVTLTPAFAANWKSFAAPDGKDFANLDDLTNKTTCTRDFYETFQPSSPDP